VAPAHSPNPTRRNRLFFYDSELDLDVEQPLDLTNREPDALPIDLPLAVPNDTLANEISPEDSLPPGSDSAAGTSQSNLALPVADSIAGTSPQGSDSPGAVEPEGTYDLVRNLVPLLSPIENEMDLNSS
jgi:hypothetical protein